MEQEWLVIDDQELVEGESSRQRRHGRHRDDRQVRGRARRMEALEHARDELIEADVRHDLDESAFAQHFPRAFERLGLEASAVHQFARHIVGGACCCVTVRLSGCLSELRARCFCAKSAHE